MNITRLLMNSVLTLGTMAGGLTAQAAVTVEVFPMMHLTPGIEKHPKAMEAYLISQHASINYISEGLSSAVFVEGNYEQLSSDLWNEGDLKTNREKLQALFPSIPYLAEQWTAEQMASLTEYRLGAHLLLALGKVAELQPTQTVKQFTESFRYSDEDLLRAVAIHGGLQKPTSEAEARWADETYEYITSTRERAALDQISEYVAKHPGVTRVSLIYGASHDFRRFQAEYPELNIRKINPRRFTRTYQTIYGNTQQAESRYDNFVFNAETNRVEILPGLDF